MECRSHPFLGANRQAKEKAAKDPVLQEHRRSHQRLNKRKELGYMKELEFDVWSKEAATRRQQYEEGELTPEAFKAWLDETSYQD